METSRKISRVEVYVKTPHPTNPFHPPLARRPSVSRSRQGDQQLTRWPEAAAHVDAMADDRRDWP